MRRLLLTDRQHAVLVALAAGQAPAPPLVQDGVQDEPLALQATLATAPQVPGGSKYLLPLDEMELAIVGVLVANRLIHLLDGNIDPPHVQALHDKITALGGIDNLALVKAPHTVYRAMGYETNHLWLCDNCNYMTEDTHAALAHGVPADLAAPSPGRER